MPNLIIPVGLPGCGKSTWARQMFDLKANIISSDKIRKELFGSLKAAHKGSTSAVESSPNNKEVWPLYHRRIDESLRHGMDTVADATNLRAFARSKLVDLANYSQASTHLIIFKNLMQALERNAKRDEDSLVPFDVMERFTEQYYNMLAEVVQEHYTTVIKIESFSCSPTNVTS